MQLKAFQVQPRSCATDMNAAAVFSHIYSSARWGIGPGTPEYYYTRSMDRPSASGHGSDLGSATLASARFLAAAIRQFNISTVVDVPCGDANWQFRTWEMDSLSAYVGLDIVPSIISLNRRRYAHHSNKRFLVWDLADCSIPRIQLGAGSKTVADLVNVRDVLQHMPRSRVEAATRNILASGTRLVVATTYPNQRHSAEGSISEGGWIPYDLNEFGFPKPSRCIPTHPRIETDLTCLYDLTSMRGSAHLGLVSEKVTSGKELSDIVTPAEQLTWQDASWVHHKLTRLSYRCSVEQRVGGTTQWGKRADGSYDGGWWLCLDEGRLTSSKDHACVVYSFGIGSDWSFEEMMGTGDAFGLSRSGFVRKKKGRGCDVFAFDPSMGQAAHVHQPGTVWFQPTGLGAADEQIMEPQSSTVNWDNGRPKIRAPGRWAMATLSSLMQSLGHSHISLLKVDVEGYEWGALLAASQNGILDKVDQLVLEVHLVPSAPQIVELGGASVFQKLVESLERQGFLLFHSVTNSFGGVHPVVVNSSGSHWPSCYELSFIKPLATAFALRSGRQEMHRKSSRHPTRSKSRNRRSNA